MPDKVDTYSFDTIRLHGIESLSELPNKSVGYDFKIYNDIFSSLFIPSELHTDKLYVFFNGAVDRNKPYPVFQRWSWNQSFPGHCLYLFDPMLYHIKGTNIAWYAGKDNYIYFSVIRKIIEKFSALLKIRGEQITCYGSSAGGFAAAAVASRIAKSKAVLINPQTDISEYYQDAVKPYSYYAFPSLDYEQFSNERPQQTNLCKIIDKHQPDLKLLYYQNIGDFHHMRNHLYPFARHYNIPLTGGATTDNSKHLLLFDDEEGHGSEPWSRLKLIIDKAASI